MKTKFRFSRRIFIIGLIAFCALWALPIVRDLKLLNETFADYRETQSTNNYGDYSYSRQLLFSYTASLILTIILVFRFARKESNGNMVAVILAAFVVIGMIIIHPERVIVLFPVIINPFLPALMLLALSVANFTAPFLLSRTSRAEK